MDETLYKEHEPWVESIARSVRSRLPPSFPLDDLKQEARIAHWKCVEAFDSTRGVPYRAFAYQAIYGAVMMSCRRKHYRESTHEELNEKVNSPRWVKGTPWHVDPRPMADDAMVEARERRLGDRRQNYRLNQVSAVIGQLAPADAFLIRRVYLEGVEVGHMAELWGISEERMNRKVKAAVSKLKREVIHAR